MWNVHYYYYKGMYSFQSCQSPPPQKKEKKHVVYAFLYSFLFFIYIYICFIRCNHKTRCQCHHKKHLNNDDPVSPCQQISLGKFKWMMVPQQWLTCQETHSADAGKNCSGRVVHFYTRVHLGAVKSSLKN